MIARTRQATSLTMTASRSSNTHFKSYRWLDMTWGHICSSSHIGVTLATESGWSKDGFISIGK